MAPPIKPSSTDGSGNNPFLEGIDQLNPQELADYLYALAEEIIASPEEYKLKMGLKKLDINDLDSIDLSTASGRRKLAKILRMLAEQALRGKAIYQATVVDTSQKTRGR